jgi:hypothetical protein
VDVQVIANLRCLATPSFSRWNVFPAMNFMRLTQFADALSTPRLFAREQAFQEQS